MTAEQRNRKRKRQREWYRKRYATDPDFRERECARKRELKRELREAGLCVDCGQPKLSERYCWDCLNQKNFHDLRRQAEEGGVDVEVDRGNKPEISGRLIRFGGSS